MDQKIEADRDAFGNVQVKGDGAQVEISVYQNELPEKIEVTIPETIWV